MLFGLFENYSSTGEGKPFKFPPIELKNSSRIVYEKLVKYITDDGYQNIKSNSDYLDIFFTDGGYEISYQIGQDENGQATLNISVYGEHKRGRTRRYLKRLILLTKEVLKDSVK